MSTMSIVSSNAPSIGGRSKRTDPLVISRDAHRDRRAGMFNFFAYIHFIGYIIILDLSVLMPAFNAALSYQSAAAQYGELFEDTKQYEKTSVALYSTIIVWDFLSVLYFLYQCVTSLSWHTTYSSLITRRRHTQSVWVNLIFLTVITIGSLIIHIMTLKILLDQ